MLFEMAYGMSCSISILPSSLSSSCDPFLIHLVTRQSAQVRHFGLSQSHSHIWICISSRSKVFLWMTNPQTRGGWAPRKVGDEAPDLPSSKGLTSASWSLSGSGVSSNLGSFGSMTQTLASQHWALGSQAQEALVGFEFWPPVDSLAQPTQVHGGKGLSHKDQEEEGRSLKQGVVDASHSFGGRPHIGRA